MGLPVNIIITTLHLSLCNKQTSVYLIIFELQPECLYLEICGWFGILNPVLAYERGKFGPVFSGKLIQCSNKTYSSLVQSYCSQYFAGKKVTFKLSRLKASRILHCFT